eukprot:gene10961-52027_t
MVRVTWPRWPHALYERSRAAYTTAPSMNPAVPAGVAPGM